MYLGWPISYLLFVFLKFVLKLLKYEVSFNSILYLSPFGWTMLDLWFFPRTNSCFVRSENIEEMASPLIPPTQNYELGRLPKQPEVNINCKTQWLEEILILVHNFQKS